MSDAHIYYIESVADGTPLLLNLPTRWDDPRNHALAVFSDQQLAKDFIVEEAKRLQKEPAELGCVHALTEEEFLVLKRETKARYLWRDPKFFFELEYLEDLEQIGD